jgi:hypothetical protein
MLWPTRFQCSGVWISSGHHCIYPYNWAYGYSILSGTKFNLHWIFQKVHKWKNVCIGIKKIKVTLVQALRLCTGRTAHRESRGIALLIHDQSTRGGWGGQRHALVTLYPRKRPGTHCTEGWVGPRPGLDSCGKSRPAPGFDPQTVQPVASRYTDYATQPTCTGVLNFIPAVLVFAHRNKSESITLPPLTQRWKPPLLESSFC